MGWGWQCQLPALGMLSGDRHHRHSLLALLICSWHRELLCAEPREKPGSIPTDATLPLEQAQEEELVLEVALKQEAFPGRAELEDLLWTPLTAPVLRGQSTRHPNMAMCLCLLINHSN